MVSKDEEGRGLTQLITESLPTFTIFSRITLTTLLTRLRFPVLQETDLLKELVH